MLPDQLLSLSHCICDFIPDVWAIEWGRVKRKERITRAAKFDIPRSGLQEVIRWTTERMNAEMYGWPNVFFSIHDAREFASRFLAVPDLVLLGISLHEEFVEAFLREEKPGPNEGESGVYTTVNHKQTAEPGGMDLGWEVLCYEYGSFHSWLCNNLETVVAKKFGIRPAANGFIASAGDALTVADYCGRDATGVEPGFWAPWLVTEYPLLTPGFRENHT